MSISTLNNLLEKHKPEFEKYAQLLIKWNKTYNITAITDSKKIWEKHFLDSLLPLNFLPKTGSILDIGTGGGFPGIPIKIVRPELSVTLIDSIQKKCLFCDAVIRELKLVGIEVVCGRAEDKKIEERIGKFDVVISRATASINDLIILSLPYLKKTNSTLIMIKGKNIDSELEDAKNIIESSKLTVYTKEIHSSTTLLGLKRA